ncbi:MAG: hypothetical protein AB7T37_15515 [Dehalococcoidia bacterium]
MTSTRTMTAFLDGPDSPDISNPIHSTDVALKFGFKAALVGGVTVYGWCAPAIVEALGARWLEDGWADIAFRRPVYPGDEMTATVAENIEGWSLEMTNAAGAACIRGTVGLGRAPWFADLQTSNRTTAEPEPATKPELTLETAPSDQDLRPMWVPFTFADATAYALEKQRDSSERWIGPDALIHPGWIAARMTPFIKHSYRYGPSIHARSRIQHLAPARVGSGVTVAGHFLRAYEDNGHHYAEYDGSVISESGVEVARIRHTTIFRPRPVTQ